ncbi:MAG: UDP-N-acetylmuramoyl-L-alanyl-D-glutamate--2,6-diaminopimelate ligase [Firmicutes bacterium]|nr:UDP-N-acetylmuramoyl-L-alanyl-D-glutamate--2,6-diaminopimelate ligase [Bacillota bacterium]
MKLGELLKLAGIENQENAELEITGVSYNSLKTQPGELFVCISGFSTDGHKYAKSAEEAGAAAILAERPLDEIAVPVIIVENGRKALSAVSAAFYGRPSDSMKVYGVTGTNGKTTISYLLRAIVEAAGHQCGVLGTIAYVYGGKTFESVNTTPESFELQRMFHEMKNDYSIDYCAMEVSSHSLALSRTDDISFDYSVFTNLTPDHMDFHTDFEDYFAAKKKLFQQTSGTSVINIDDEYGKRLYNELFAEGKNVFSCSVDDETAYYRAVIKDTSAAGTNADIFAGEKMLGSLKINTPGRFSVANAICAIGVTMESGISWEAAKAGIEETRGVSGRFESVENSHGIPVIVDYAHTPDALEKIIKTAREFTTGRVITVFGCGGDRDATKRPVMGNIAGTYSDFCVVTSDNPRTEDPYKILDDIVPGVEKTDCPYEVVEDRRRGIKRALKEWTPGDTVIIAGKGHENYQIIGKVKHYFDDKETALQIIEQEL